VGQLVLYIFDAAADCRLSNSKFPMFEGDQTAPESAHHSVPRFDL